MMSCMKSGRIQTRAKPIEKYIAQIGKEAGLNGKSKTPVSSLGLIGVDPGDARRLDFSMDGFDEYGGLPLVGDATIRSPVAADGRPHQGAASSDGSTFKQAHTDKISKYGDIFASGQVAFVVFACETGGRWSPEALFLIRALARWRVQDLPFLIRNSFRMAFLRRWWGLLSCTLQDSVAASLDPSDRLLQRGFSSADEFDALASLRDNPLPLHSRLPLNG